MKRYVIERDLPGVGASRAAQRRSGDLQWRAGEAVCDRVQASHQFIAPARRERGYKVKNPKAPAATRAVDGTF
jgi:hypothetical protein